MNETRCRCRREAYKCLSNQYKRNYFWCPVVDLHLWSGPKDDTISTEETQDGCNNSFQTIEEETKGTGDRDHEDAQPTQAELEQKGVCVCVCACLHV